MNTFFFLKEKQKNKKHINIRERKWNREGRMERWFLLHFVLLIILSSTGIIWVEGL